MTRSEDPSSEHDIVYTPFMMRARKILDGTESTPTTFDLRASELGSVASIVDGWFYLRARSEQLVAEANAMTTIDGPLDLEDESGTNRLSFTVRTPQAWFRLRVEMVEHKRQAFIELDRSQAPTTGPTEPVDTAAVDDLILSLLIAERPEDHP